MYNPHLDIINSPFKKVQLIILVGCLLSFLAGIVYSHCPQGAYYYARQKVGTPMLVIEYLRDGIDYLIIVSLVIVLILAIRDFIKIIRRRVSSPKIIIDELGDDINNDSYGEKYIQDEAGSLKRIPKKYILISVVSIALVILSVLLSFCYVVSALMNTEESQYVLVPTWIYTSLAIVIEGSILSVFSCGIYIIIKVMTNRNLKLLNGLTGDLSRQLESN